MARARCHARRGSRADASMYACKMPQCVCMHVGTTQQHAAAREGRTRWHQRARTAAGVRLLRGLRLQLTLERVVRVVVDGDVGIVGVAVGHRAANHDEAPVGLLHPVVRDVHRHLHAL